MAYRPGVEMPLSLLFALSSGGAELTGAVGDPIRVGDATLNVGLTSGHQLRRAHRTRGSVTSSPGHILWWRYAATSLVRGRVTRYGVMSRHIA